MAVFLGIDTGGTYTDGVILDKNKGKILSKAKALTTREDLSIGISQCLDNLEFPQEENVQIVCLSTTLATNAVVEGKGSKAGVIIINPAAEKEAWPAEQSCFLHGKMDIKGNEIEPVAPEETAKVLEQMKGKADAIAVSGYASVRNPKQELFVKEQATKLLNVPVVCGHELTRSLGYRERTVTAILNAKLIAVIQQLMDKTKAMLNERGINAPVVIMKGDGHFMMDSFAEGRPIETVLSGPAASVVGAAFLTHVREGLIVDIGGTTTDIACISRGTAPLSEDGALVGGWQTKVKAIDMQTFGIGGDSCLNLEKGKMSFGPQRAEPLCSAAARASYLTEELKNADPTETYQIKGIQPFDCFRLLNKPKGEYLTDQDREILKLLKDGPHSVSWIGKRIGRKVKYLRLDKLMKAELIQKISLTPTDLLHACGDYVKWNREASLEASRIAMRQMGMDEGMFLQKAKQQFIDQLSFALIKSMLIFENKENAGMDYGFLEKGISGELGDGLEMSLRLNKPVVGVGAPAAAWLPAVCERLSAALILPEDGDVANAIGAAAGNIEERVEALIKYSQENLKYVVYGPWGKGEFVTIEEAKAYAVKNIKRCARELAEEAGMQSCTVHINEEMEYEDLNNISKWKEICQGCFTIQQRIKA